MRPEVAPDKALVAPPFTASSFTPIAKRRGSSSGTVDGITLSTELGIKEGELMHLLNAAFQDKSYFRTRVHLHDGDVVLAKSVADDVRRRVAARAFPDERTLERELGLEGRPRTSTMVPGLVATWCGAEGKIVRTVDARGLPQQRFSKEAVDEAFRALGYRAKFPKPEPQDIFDLRTLPGQRPHDSNLLRYFRAAADAGRDGQEATKHFCEELSVTDGKYPWGYPLLIRLTESRNPLVSYAAAQKVLEVGEDCVGYEAEVHRALMVTESAITREKLLRWCVDRGGALKDREADFLHLTVAATEPPVRRAGFAALMAIKADSLEYKIFCEALCKSLECSADDFEDAHAALLRTNAISPGHSRSLKAAATSSQEFQRMCHVHSLSEQGTGEEPLYLKLLDRSNSPAMRQAAAVFVVKEPARVHNNEKFLQPFAADKDIIVAGLIQRALAL